MQEMQASEEMIWCTVGSAIIIATNPDEYNLEALRAARDVLQRYSPIQKVSDAHIASYIEQLTETINEREKS